MGSAIVRFWQPQGKRKKRGYTYRKKGLGILSGEKEERRIKGVEKRRTASQEG